jgi:parallel beta-helix repeat protein
MRTLTRRAVAAFLLLLPFSSGAIAATITVSNSPALAGALAAANPGDTIVLAPGEYRLGGNTTNIRRPGSAAQPITVRAAQPGKARIRSETDELFKIFVPYWAFEGIDFQGHDNAEHAFHVVAGADHTTFRANRFRNFNAAIKGNPEGGKSPSFMTLERNAIYNDAPRKTEEPVTAIDVVGGEGWVLRENFIADFAKDGGDDTSYGAFLKGASSNGIFEGNLVICEWRHTGGGLSFGGGGTEKAYMGGATDEHSRGIMRNNIVLNCPEAEGIYLNRASDSKIYNNTIYNAYGIVARFPARTASDIRNNIISGAVATRAEASVSARDNVETGRSIGEYIPAALRSLKLQLADYGERWPSIFTPDSTAMASRTIDDLFDWLGRSSFGRGLSDFDGWFRDPKAADLDRRDVARLVGRGQPVPEVKTDFCGQKRVGSTDLGAIEYSAGRCDVAGRIKALTAPFN